MAGTAEAVLMIEGFADFLPEEKVLEGLELGLAAVRTIALALTDWAAAVGKPKWSAGVREKPAELRAAFERLRVTEQLKVAGIRVRARSRSRVGARVRVRGEG